jgi:uncharacterized SAM-binding protein YcdF (DUF218 family)
VIKRGKWFKRRELLLPRWPLVLIFFVFLAGAGMIAARVIHPFLAVTKTIDAPDLLVVEGWMADYNLPLIVEEFRKGPYQRIAATGIALDRGSYLEDYQSYGEVTAASLKTLGVKDSNLIVGATTDTRRHRTYTAAKALKQAIDASDLEVDAFTVFSQTVHSRRTHIIFQKVFGDSVEIGIVALPDESYDNDRWWGSSAGIKSVGMEVLALAYEWLLDSGRTEY